MKYTDESTTSLAKRCIKCKNPQCKEFGCPAKIDIPMMIKLYQEEKYDEAFKVICESSNLPYICSWVCDYNKLCAKGCILNKINNKIYPGLIEKDIVSKIIQSNKEIYKECFAVRNKIGKAVAIIGGGPSGISAAIELAKNGFNVTIFEREPKIGGELIYGIPFDRLPKENMMLQEEILKHLNVQIITNKTIQNVSEIEKCYDYIIVSKGLESSVRLSVPGSELDGVISGREFLKKYNYGLNIDSFKKIKTVVIIGGGNTALDCAYVATKIAEKVIVIYRRTKEEMRVNFVELDEIASCDNIEFLYLTNPNEYMGKEHIEGIKLDVLKLSDEPGEDGRRYPIKTEKEKYVSCDLVVEALGQKRSDEIKSSEKVHLIGDYKYGAKTVVEAMHDGKELARKLIEENS